MLTPLKILSVFACLLIVVGVLNRRRKRVHIPLMLTALTIDLGIVLFLELTRAVIESLPGREMTPLLIIHICLSTSVLALYAVQVVTGIKNARGRHSRVHSKVPVWFIIVRFGNLITSFLVT